MRPLETPPAGRKRLAEPDYAMVYEGPVINERIVINDRVVINERIVMNRRVYKVNTPLPCPLAVGYPLSAVVALPGPYPALNGYYMTT